MKKIFLLTLTLCMAFVLTACTTKDKNDDGGNTGKKEEVKDNVQYLSCNRDFSDQMTADIKMDQDVNIKFVNNKIQDFSMKMNFVLPSTLASNADTFVNTMKSTYDEKYGKYNGVKVTLDRTSQEKFSILITMDFPKLTSEEKTALGLVGSEDYTVNKNSFVRTGYTCK